MVLVLILALGLVQTAFALYGRNVVVAAAHEGVRSGIELGRNPTEAATIARSTIGKSAGGLVDELRVKTVVTGPRDALLLRVEVTATLEPFGPIPVGIPVHARAQDFLERSAL